MKNIKGLIWYAERYYAGTEDDYYAFYKKHKEGKLIYTFNRINKTQLKKLSDSLNELNGKRSEKKAGS